MCCRVPYWLSVLSSSINIICCSIHYWLGSSDENNNTWLVPPCWFQHVFSRVQTCSLFLDIANFGILAICKWTILFYENQPILNPSEVSCMFLWSFTHTSIKTSIKHTQRFHRKRTIYKTVHVCLFMYMALSVNDSQYNNKGFIELETYMKLSLSRKPLWLFCKVWFQICVKPQCIIYETSSRGSVCWFRGKERMCAKLAK